MARSVNRVTLVGNVGKDPEIRTTQSGQRIASITVATSDTWKDKQTGEQKERTEWHRVAVMSDGLAGVCENYIKKGSRIFLEGALQTRKWQDQSGQERYTTEIVISPFKGEIVLLDRAEGGQKSQQRQEPAGSKPEIRQHTASAAPDLDDDIPF